VILHRGGSRWMCGRSLPRLSSHAESESNKDECEEEVNVWSVAAFSCSVRREIKKSFNFLVALPFM